MKNKWIFATCLGMMVLGAGCALQPSIEETESSEAMVSENNPGTETQQTTEATAPNVVELEQTVSDSTADEGQTEEHLPVEIEDLEEPLDANGQWTNYRLVTDEREYTMEGEEVGVYGTRFYVHDFPIVAVDDLEIQQAINDKLFYYVINDYYNRFQLKDLDISLTCSVLHQTRFVTYQMLGTVKHVGDDMRYEYEREYRYYINVDRMTMQRLNLATVMDWSTVKEAISTGDYDVVQAQGSVFSTFSNELLADIYLNNPAYADDTEHEMDFYLEDGAVNVMIWVGEENGFYAILRLHPEPLLQ